MTLEISQLLFSFILIFAVSMLIIYILHFIDIPPLVGYLITGIIIGPAGFHLITDNELIDTLAEVGIIFLLFLIGVEFSLQEFLKQSKTIIILGALQVIPTTLIAAFLALIIGFSLSQSIFLGLLLTMSSTAIVMKLLIDRGELDTTHGKLASGICIFQDLVIVVIVLLLPILGGETSFSLGLLMLSLLKSFVIILGTFGLARVVVPIILNRILKTQIRELFLLTIITMCFGVAFTTSYLGLSLEIGAFIVGLVISESDYHHYVITEVLPFKDIFTILFFISIGLLLDLQVIYEQPIFILFLIVGIIVLKFVVLFVGPIFMGYSRKTSILVAITLSQIGEFSFILAREGLKLDLIDNKTYQLLLISTILTMMLTPLFVQNSSSIIDYIDRLRFINKFGRKNTISDQEKTLLKDHVIIVGYGINGQNLRWVMGSTGIDHIIIEMDPGIYEMGKVSDATIIFGDATKEHVLKAVNIHQAKAIVIATSDPNSTPRILQNAKLLNPNIFAVVRTRYLADIEELSRLGANEVVSEEYETSLAITSMVLSQYSLSTEDILEHIHNLRQSADLIKEITKKA